MTLEKPWVQEVMDKFVRFMLFCHVVTDDTGTCHVPQYNMTKLMDQNDQLFLLGQFFMDENNAVLIARIGETPA